MSYIADPTFYSFQCHNISIHIRLSYHNKSFSLISTYLYTLPPICVMLDTYCVHNSICLYHTLCMHVNIVMYVSLES